MKLTITLEMDNDAFHPVAGYEAARVLTRLAKLLDGVDLGTTWMDAGKLVDSNGNTCGRWEITD